MRHPHWTSDHRDALLAEIALHNERVVILEDTRELKCAAQDCVTLRTKPGVASLSDLVRSTLRLRPDRIVVGEVRGPEALDMLQAMNTGHEGSLTTLHANSPRDALSRLETLVLMAGDSLPLAAIRDQIASAVDIIVQQARFSCGSRKVTSITEVCGTEAGRIQLQEIFRFSRSSQRDSGEVAGVFTGCDCIPSFFEPLREHGEALDLESFRRQCA